MDPQSPPPAPRPELRFLIPSISAAAHCAQSCLRLWTSLLDDATSVSLPPHADDRSEDEEDDDELAQQQQQQQEHGEDELLVVSVARRTPEEWSALLDAPLFRPESYMRPRSLHWWNHYVGFAKEDDPRYADVFRLPVGFFTTVCPLVREDMQQGDIPLSLRNVEGRMMSVEKQVAIAVMRLTTGNTFSTVSKLLGCGRSTVVKIVYKFVASVRQKAASFLQWPANAEQSARVKEGFARKHGLVNCCGALDATHVAMELPAGESADVWLDRNHNFSIILQAIVDTDLRFLDVCVGYPGSLNDSRCLRESAFYRRCCNGERLNGEPMQIGAMQLREYIVGDQDYPLLQWLMTPYRQSELSPQRAVYNGKLSSTRVIVARAFGRLKGTWRILHGTVLQPNIERLPKVIHACCILHNMCIDAGGVEGVHFPEPEGVTDNNMEGFGNLEDDESEEARHARENICTYVNSLE